MGVVRRAALILSLVLIVAIAVGYAARRSELAGDRDLRLTTAAELASSELTAMIETVAVAAEAGTDPAAAASAVASVNPTMRVCALSVDARSCDGVGPRPPAATLSAVEASREAGQLRSRPVVTVYDSLMTIEADGPHLSLIAHGSADIGAIRSEVSTKASTFLPTGTLGGGFFVDRGLRQTATEVDSAVGVYVVASGADAFSLPTDEQRFYMIIFGLAVVLLVLAGVTLIVEQRSLLERASFDLLTKLPNRSEFERRAVEALSTAERTDETASLLLFDLNEFKQVNDTYGHSAGDELLRVVAIRLRKAVRDGDIVARWGGDEFVVMMPGIGTEEMATRRARQLADAVGGRTRIDGVDHSLRVKVSVGVSLWPDHGPSLASLVGAADSAMYQAKRDGIVSRLATVVPDAAPVATTV